MRISLSSTLNLRYPTLVYLVKMILNKSVFLCFVLVIGLVQGSVSFTEDSTGDNSSRFELHRRIKRNVAGQSTREPRFLKFQNLNDSIDVNITEYPQLI